MSKILQNNASPLAWALTACLIFTIIATPIHTSAAWPTLTFDPIDFVLDQISSAAEKMIEKLQDAQTLKEYVLDPLAYIAVTGLLNAMTNTILGWIQGTDSGFIENLEDELTRSADAMGGRILNQIATFNLCGNIGAFLRLSLSAPLSLRQRLECTATQIVANVEDFYQDFQQGGWPAFFEISLRPQNNAYGAYLLSLDATVEAQTKAQDTFRQNIAKGKGFLGFRVSREANCEFISTAASAEIQKFMPLDTIKGDQKLKKITDNPDEEATYQLCDIEYDEKTPGSVFSDGLSNSIFTGPDRVKLADEIGEAVDAALSQIIFALLQKTIEVSTGSGQGVRGSPELTQLPTVIVPVEVGFQPTYLTSQTDDAMIRLQATETILDTQIQGLDIRITDINRQIAILQAACDDTDAITICDQVRIDQLKEEKAPLETEKGEKMALLSRAQSDLGQILDIRVQIFTSTDSAFLQSLSTHIIGLTSDAEQIIQEAGGPPIGQAGPDTTDNMIRVIDNSQARAAANVTFLDSKIAAADTSTQAALITIQTDLVRLSEDLGRIKTDILAQRDDQAAVLQLTSEATPKIKEIDAKIFNAYSL